MTASHAPFICTKTLKKFPQEIYKIERVLGQAATEYLGLYPNFEALEKVEKQLYAAFLAVHSLWAHQHLCLERVVCFLLPDALSARTSMAAFQADC